MQSDFDSIVRDTWRAIRELKNIKQETIAECLAMSQGNYSKIENGEVAVTLTQLKIIAKELEMSISQLMAIADLDSGSATTPLSEMIIDFICILQSKKRKRTALTRKELDIIIANLKAGSEKVKAKPN